MKIGTIFARKNQDVPEKVGNTNFVGSFDPS
jgi:hypothetical protein